MDVGAAGRAEGGGVYGESALKKAIKSNLTPPPQNIQGVATKIHYHMVVDDAFPMSSNLMN